MNSNETTATEFEVRTGEDVDVFTDGLEAQAWAVRMANQGHAPTVHRRINIVTTVEGAWEEVPVVASEEVPVWARDQFGIFDGQFPVAAEKAGDTE